jgi:protein NEDD1
LESQYVTSAFFGSVYAFKHSFSTTMLAATTTDTLCITDPAVLKKAPSSIPSCLDLINPPTASSWSFDNAFLYLSSAHTIHKYDPSLNTLTNVYTSDGRDSITHLVLKDKGTLLFAVGDKIQVLEGGKVTRTFDSHKSSVTSLSLSNDSTLLASTSTGAAHVYNLSLGSHTVLRGLTGQSIHACTFHPHARTRLLLACGKQLMVYDTTRPSGPSKTVVMSESVSGNITSVACSPFSKTLVAVATSGGFVGLIDLEKEKA